MAMHGENEGRLDSWKKIAAYLKREVSTVQRWERREGMPVHRHMHDRQGSVYAFRSELDAWWQSRRVRLEAAAPRAPALRLRRWALPGAATLGALLLIALLTWLGAARERASFNPLGDARFSRLAEFAGIPQAAAISGDGRLVAFLAAREGRTDLWLGEIGGGSYRNLTHGALRELADNPAIRELGFAPDSSVVFAWTRRGDGSHPEDVNVVAVPVAGGAPQTYLAGIAEFAWSADRSRLVYHTTAPGDPIFERVGAAAARQVYVAPAGVHCHFPLLAADQEFIYFVRGVPPDDWDIWRIRPDGAGLERLTSQHARISYPLLIDRRTLLYLATDAYGGGPWIYAVDVERRAPHRVSAGLETFTSLSASADGTRLVATVASPRTSLWRLPLGGRGAAAPAAGAPTLLVAHGAAPRLGPDMLAYVSAHGATQGLWTLKSGAAHEIWSSRHESVVGAPAVAPDGSRIAFVAAEGDRTRLYVVNSDGSRPRVLGSGLALRGSPAWAPDGRALVAAVLRDGEPRLMRISLDDAAPLPLVSEYALDPVFSPDGALLVYSGADIGTTFPLRGAAADGRPHPIPNLMLTRGARRVAFAGDARSLVVLRGGIGHKDLERVDLNDGSERLLAALPPEFVIRDFDVSADGTGIVLERAEADAALALIERQ